MSRKCPQGSLRKQRELGTKWDMSLLVAYLSCSSSSLVLKLHKICSLESLINSTEPHFLTSKKIILFNHPFKNIKSVAALR
jgi:hypothetical protein